MKTVCLQDKCTGCMACVQICQHNAIEIVDNMLSYNAVICADKCVQCGLCRKVCPNHSPVTPTYPKSWFQGWANDSDVREKSASGGYAAAIARGFVAKGGTVCSCIFANGQFVFDFASTEERLSAFVGSKYVKSNPNGVYKRIKDKLQENEKILFIGLPCQVAALKNYISKDKQQNLYTVDLICHGTPSPKVLDVFLRQHGKHLECANDVAFRNRGNYQISVDGQEVAPPGVCDSYIISFLNAATCTESCYSCPYASVERVSDLTLGDSWGSELLEKHKKSGVSLCLCQTEKGRELLDMSDIHTEEVDLDNATEHNHQLKNPSVKPSCRHKILAGIEKGKSFDRMVMLCLPSQSAKQFMKSVLIRFGLWRK